MDLGRGFSLGGGRVGLQGGLGRILAPSMMTAQVFGEKEA